MNCNGKKECASESSTCVPLEEECAKLMEHRACKSEFQALCKQIVESRAVLNKAKQERIKCHLAVEQANQDIKNWKYKTQAFLLGQPKTKARYKENWINAVNLYKVKSVELTTLDQNMIRYESEYRQALSNCSKGLVKLAASVADCGGTAAELCLQNKC